MKEIRVGQVYVEVEYSPTIDPVSVVQRPEFPDKFGRWAEGGPRFRTEIWTNRDGEETRSVLASRPLWEWAVPIGDQEPVDVAELIDLFRACGGQVVAFKFLNPLASQLTLEPIGWGDGEETIFQARKRYSAGGRVVDVDVRNLERGSATVYLCDQANGSTPTMTDEGTDFVVDYDLGRVIFATAPEDQSSVLLTAKYFHLARFAAEDVLAEITSPDSFGVGSIEIMEVPNG